MEFTVSQVAELIGGEVVGSGEVIINTIQPIDQATEKSVTFLSNPKYEPHLYTTKAGAVIVRKDFEINGEISPVLIRVDDPYISFTALLEAYDRLTSIQKTGIEQPSFIDKESSLGEDCYLGAFAYVGAKTTIGNNCSIYPGAYIGDNVVIGDNCIIHPGAKIYAKTKIGSHCIIHAGTIIGSDGFGFAPLPDRSYKKIPQLGNVILEDHVEIGANTVVDCATFDSTIIRSGVKLDNLIQIGHNVEIDQHTVIAAQTGISGSSKVGKYCVIGGQVGMVGHIKVADGTKVGAKAGINRDTKPDQELRGTYAFDARAYGKSYVVFRKLPAMLKQVEELEKKLINLATNQHSK
jgi:UDP-3-O-[3-hydroxymyristoyl] glucosamine N-acyltransferase